MSTKRPIRPETKFEAVVFWTTYVLFWPLVVSFKVLWILYHTWLGFTQDELKIRSQKLVKRIKPFFLED